MATLYAATECHKNSARSDEQPKWDEMSSNAATFAKEAVSAGVYNAWRVCVLYCCREWCSRPGKRGTLAKTVLANCSCHKSCSMLLVGQRFVGANMTVTGFLLQASRPYVCGSLMIAPGLMLYRSRSSLFSAVASTQILKFSLEAVDQPYAFPDHVCTSSFLARGVSFPLGFPGSNCEGQLG